MESPSPVYDRLGALVLRLALTSPYRATREKNQRRFHHTSKASQRWCAVCVVDFLCLCNPSHSQHNSLFLDVSKLLLSPLLHLFLRVLAFVDGGIKELRWTRRRTSTSYFLSSNARSDDAHLREGKLSGTPRAEDGGMERRRRRNTLISILL